MCVESTKYKLQYQALKKGYNSSFYLECPSSLLPKLILQDH